MEVYRSKYQSRADGRIGIALNAHYGMPSNSSSMEDQQAAARLALGAIGYYYYSV